MLSPDLYREFCLPQVREYSDIMHAAGKILVAQSYGEPIKGILSDILESGLDALGGYREETPGNATLEEIRNAWQGRVCLIGGIDTDILCRLSGDELSVQLDAFIQRVKPDDRIILSTNSTVMRGTSKENLKLVGKIVQQHLWRR